MGQTYLIYRYTAKLIDEIHYMAIILYKFLTPKKTIFLFSMYSQIGFGI